MIARLMTLLLLIFYSTMVLAAQPGLGAMANNMMQPVGLASDFVGTACLLIGGGFVFASIIKYFEHRRSPLMVPISTVVFLLIAGLILLLMSFIAKITDTGLPSFFGK